MNHGVNRKTHQIYNPQEITDRLLHHHQRITELQAKLNNDAFTCKFRIKHDLDQHLKASGQQARLLDKILTNGQQISDKYWSLARKN